jgi:ribonuclease T1
MVRPVTVRRRRHADDAGVATVVRNVTVRDMDGRVAYRGDVDLAPALARIEAGERDAHRNDGGVFGNREGLLPRREHGYYREYVVRTPGITHAGPQRLVIGADGDVWYTHDHYSSFTRVR